MKKLLLCFLFLLCPMGLNEQTFAKQQKRINTLLQQKYDKYKDRSSLSTFPVATTKSGLRFQIGFYSTGKDLQKPKELKVYFDNQSSSGWKFLKNQELSLIIDGELYQHNGELARDSEVGTAYDPWKAAFSGYGYYTVTAEALSGNISSEMFEKLAKASSVEGRLGNTEFKLSKANLEGIKELSKRINELPEIQETVK